LDLAGPSLGLRNPYEHVKLLIVVMILLVIVTNSPTLATAETAGTASASPTASPSPTVAPSDAPTQPFPSATPVDHSVKLGSAVLLDYTSFSQDPTSVDQVGWQHSQAELRAARVIASGNLSGSWSYYVSGNYNGLDRSPDEPILGFYDIYLTTHLGSTKLQLGKQKETFIYEMVGDASNLPQLERILGAWEQSRSVGVRLSDTAFGQRMTWSGGGYGLENGVVNQATARVTGLPAMSQDGADYLHLGVDYRYQGANNDTLRYRTKPQSDVASYFVDTGSFPADSANLLNFEGLAAHGPLSAYGEYVRSWVNAPQDGNPEFFGYYMVGSWVLTGEHRRYDRAAGFARGIVPIRSTGAWELVAQYSRVDLNNAQINGGSMGVGYVGVNWFKTANWRFSLGYGVTGLDRFNSYGVTDRIQTRVQWQH
jgi:phosphate-selective porin OprO and OprP